MNQPEDVYIVSASPRDLHVDENSPTALPPSFRAGRALAVLALVLLTQIIVVIMVAVAAIVVDHARDTKPKGIRGSAPAGITVTIVLLSQAAGVAATYVLARAWAPSWLKDRGASGIGPLRLSVHQVASAGLCGIALGAAGLVMMKILIPPSPDITFGPLARLLALGGSVRLALACVAVLIAPPFEEVLFRGLLFKGFAASWGVVPGGIAVSVLFTAMHLPEVVHYWPGALAILVLSIATLCMRIKSGALASAVILHASYNLVIVAAIYWPKTA